jgi:phosphate transport system substrate-binding protein
MEMNRMQRWKTPFALALGLAVVAMAAACGSSGSSGSSSGGGGASSSTVLNGAGSTLVAPLISQWEPDYAKSAGITITYGAVGSGGGIDAITQRNVDFGASDAPLTSDQATACKNCLLIPWALGATVVTYNVKGVPNKLKLDGPTVANIYLGKITSWDDPAIKALNPGVNLPATHITPMWRSDGSGDSFVFTSYLSAVSPDWKSQVGASTQPSFPAGQGAEKNSGVAAAVQATDGAIGYVAVSYIAADSLDEALLKNQGGQFPEPTTSAITAAASAVSTIQPDGSVPLVNPPASAADAYPMSTYTYAIIPQVSPKAKQLMAFLTYAIGSTGQAFGPPLGFPPLPDAIVAHDKTVIAKIATS